MNPSRFQLPHQVYEDRQRARRATLRQEQRRFEFVKDMAVVENDAGAVCRLPPSAMHVPPDVDFHAWQKVRLGLAKLTMKLRGTYATGRMAFSSFDDGAAYEQFYRRLFYVEGPGRWRNDLDFARQRLDGVNPMAIRRLHETEDPRLAAAIEDARKQYHHQGFKNALGAELYYLDYSVLWHGSVQEHVRPRDKRPLSLAAPTCVFWLDGQQLRPLVIRLKPAWVAEHNPVFTPFDRPADWLIARAHVAAADTHMHEGVYHLLETHLINEAVALCLYRQLHPDHPLRQLLEPHYHGTMAINRLARGHLIAHGGPIDTCMAAGRLGTLNAARLEYSKWNWTRRTLSNDLEERGVKDLPNYHYAQDAKVIHHAIRNFVGGFLGSWYREDTDVRKDYELREFLREAGSPQGGAIPGFPLPAREDGSVSTQENPPHIDSREKLFDLVTDLIFRAGPQHAAVNNGQFDVYGEIPNSPGMVCGTLPETAKAPYGEDEFWKLMPARKAALGQAAMVWILSMPTRRNILYMGDFPAFDPRLSFQALESIVSLRRRLQMISYDIQKRNEALAVPYHYMDPQNVALSTDV
jgi:arachidonate 15-lipoxygenase